MVSTEPVWIDGTKMGLYMIKKSGLQTKISMFLTTQEQENKIRGLFNRLTKNRASGSKTYVEIKTDGAKARKAELTGFNYSGGQNTGENKAADIIISCGLTLQDASNVESAAVSSCMELEPDRGINQKKLNCTVHITWVNFGQIFWSVTANKPDKNTLLIFTGKISVIDTDTGKTAKIISVHYAGMSGIENIEYVSGLDSKHYYKAKLTGKGTYKAAEYSVKSESWDTYYVNKCGKSINTTGLPEKFNITPIYINGLKMDAYRIGGSNKGAEISVLLSTNEQYNKFCSLYSKFIENHAKGEETFIDLKSKVKSGKHMKLTGCGYSVSTGKACSISTLYRIHTLQQYFFYACVNVFL